MGCTSSRAAVNGPPETHSDDSSPRSAVPQPPAPEERGWDTSILKRARLVLNKLSCVASDGSRASLGRAALVLLDHLREDGADAVWLSAVASGGRAVVPGCAAGLDDGTVSEQVACTVDAAAGAAVCAARAPVDTFLYCSAGEPPGSAAGLPPDWALLAAREGLRSFLAHVVCAPGKQPLGVMTLASRRAGAFKEPWWDALLSLLGVGLSPLLSHPLLSGLCELAAVLHAHITDPRCSYESLISLLLECSSELLRSVTGQPLHVRLGLMSPQQYSGLMLHYLCSDTNGSLAAGCGGASGGRGGGSGDMADGRSGPGANVLSSLCSMYVPTASSVFAEAMTSRRARFIVDTSAHLQASFGTVCDVVVRGHESASSLVVLPFVLPPLPRPMAAICDGPAAAPVGSGGGGGGSASSSNSSSNCSSAPLHAALYVADVVSSDFRRSRQAITSLVALLQLALAPCLAPGGLLHAHLPLMLCGREEAAQRRRDIGLANVARPAGLVTVMREHVRARVGPSQAVQELHVQRALGRGAFGVVYAASWGGVAAAVKVMVVSQQQRRVIKTALEMAVQESLSHPNIVRVYACLTDMVMESGRTPSTRSSKSSAPVARVSFRSARPDDHAHDAAVQQCNLMVMELCDRGDLMHALNAGIAHTVTPEGAVRVSMPRLCALLIDIARSLAYLHSLGLVHCDVKAANVLLRSSPDSALGVVCKLSDFGLVKLLCAGRDYLHNCSVSGTLNYIAPERFVTGSQLSAAVDVYAFGQLMYAAYTRQLPYHSMAPAAIISAIMRHERPSFPAGTPPSFAALAAVCWSPDPAQRPTMERVLQQLVAYADRIHAQCRRA